MPANCKCFIQGALTCDWNIANPNGQSYKNITHGVLPRGTAFNFCLSLVFTQPAFSTSTRVGGKCLGAHLIEAQERKSLGECKMQRCMCID